MLFPMLLGVIRKSWERDPGGSGFFVAVD